MKDPNQLSFDDEPVETPPVHGSQMSIEYGETNTTEPIEPVKYPSVEIGKRALYLLSAIDNDMEASKKNGLIKLRESENASTRLLDRLVNIRDDYMQAADRDFSKAWGSVDELVEAGFDRVEVNDVKQADVDSYLRIIKDRSSREKLRRRLKKQL